MTDDTPRGWRSLPLAFVLAIAGSIVWTVVRTTVAITGSPERAWSPRIVLVGAGVFLAADVLTSVGLFSLSRRLAGREALGATIAAWAFAVSAAFGAISSFIYNYAAAHDARSVFDVMRYLWFGLELVGLGGLALAASRRVAVAAIAGVLGIFAFQPPFLDNVLFGWLDLGFRAGYALEAGLHVVRLGIYLVLAAVAVAGSQGEPRDVAVATDGLRLCSKALWLRVIAAVGVVLLTLMAMGSSGGGGEGMVEVVKLAMMTGAILNVLALAMFGLGAARAAGAGLSDLPRLPLVIGAAASLWAAGVGADQASYLYSMLYHGAGDYLGGGELTEQVQALSVAVPLIVIAGVAVIAAGIGALATRRSSRELGEHAQGKGIGFVMLMLVSIAIQSWMLPKAESLSGFAMMSLLAAGAALAATVLMAKLCTLAADELEREPGLPQATVV